MTLFDELQPRLTKAERATLQSPEGITAQALLAAQVLTARAQGLDARLATFDNDPSFAERLVREGY